MGKEFVETRQCIYESVPGDSRTRCALLALYVVLMPPQTIQPTPSPIWLQGEARTVAKARQRETPLFCRQHAYQVAGIPYHELSIPF